MGVENVEPCQSLRTSSHSPRVLEERDINVDALLLDLVETYYICISHYACLAIVLLDSLEHVLHYPPSVEVLEMQLSNILHRKLDMSLSLPGLVQGSLPRIPIRNSPTMLCLG